MKTALLLAAATGLVLLILSAGCTSPTDIRIPGAETPMPLPLVTPTPEATAVEKPVAVETLPPEQFVNGAPFIETFTFEEISKGIEDALAR